MSDAYEPLHKLLKLLAEPMDIRVRAWRMSHVDGITVQVTDRKTGESFWESIDVDIPPEAFASYFDGVVLRAAGNALVELLKDKIK